MKGSTQIYRPDGTVDIQDWTTDPPLKFLQDAVGGYLEAVPFFNRLAGIHGPQRAVAYCNEEGKLQGLPVNVHATIITGVPIDPNDLLVGNVVVVTGDHEFMHLHIEGPDPKE